MKRTIICILIVFCLTAIAVSSLMLINGVSDNIIGKLELVQKYFDEEAYSEAETLAQEAELEWKQLNFRAFLVVDKDQLNEINQVLTRISALAEERDDDIKIECKTALVMLMFFKESQRVSFNNIL